MSHKNRLATIILPVLSSIAIIGAGFSTWYFTGSFQGNLDEQFACNITKARAAGTVFSFAKGEITFDQKGITYAENSYVGFGYIGETFNDPIEEAQLDDDNFVVNFYGDDTKQVQGPSIKWGRLDNAGADKVLIDAADEVTIGTVDTEYKTLTFQYDENQFTIYYLVYTSNDAGAKEAAEEVFESTVKDLSVTTNLNQEVSLADFDMSTADSADTFAAYALPELNYAAGFDVHDLATYLTLKEKVEYSALDFSAFVDIAQPQN